MSEHSGSVQRWTAKRRAALVLGILQGETSAEEAARKHELTVAEVEEWKERFMAAAENALEPLSHDSDGEVGQHRAALAESELRLAHLVDATWEAIVIHEEGIVLEANEQYFSMFGYEREELIGQEGISRTTTRESGETIRQQVHAGSRGPYKVTGKRKDGSQFPMEIRIRMMDFQGRQVRVAAIRDMSAQEEIEQALREGEMRLSEINQCLLGLGADYEANVDALTALCGRQLGGAWTLYSRLHDGLLRPLGQWHGPSGHDSEDRLECDICHDVIRRESDEPLVVRHLGESHHAETDPNVARHGLRTHVGHRVLCGGEPVGSLCVVYKDDVEPRESDLRVLGILAAALGAEEDRKCAGEALRASEETYRNLLTSLNAGVVVHAPDTSVLLSNPAAAEMLGLSEEQMAGKRSVDSRWKFLREDGSDMPLDEHPVNRVLSSNKPLRNLVVGVNRPEKGDTAWLLVNGFPVHQDSGQLEQIVINFVGITERKRAEEALEKRMVALTQPLDAPEGITFEELLNLDNIQRLQDQFAKATGVASIITDVNGKPITAPSNFCRLCKDIIRKTDKGLANCFKSDARVGSPNSHGSTVQPCMSGGLWDASAGVSVGGKHIANWLIGQVRDDTQTEEGMRQYAREIGADEEETIRAFREVPSMSRTQFDQVAQALYTMANQLSSIAYQNVRQARFISERRRAQEALRNEKEFIDKAIDSLPGIFYLFSKEGRFLRWNRNFETVSGYSADEFRIMHLLDFVLEEDRSLVEKRVAEVLEKGESFAEAHMLSKDGTRTFYYLTGVRVDIGGTPCLVGMGIDIDERKRHETERERLMSAIDQAAETIVITDTEGTIEYVNPAFELTTGYTRAEAIGENPRILKSGNHDAAFYRELWDRLARGEVWTGRLVNKKKDGTLFTEEAVLSPVRDETGRIVSHVAVKRDITHELGLENQLLQAQKMEAVGQLAGGVAHDFNNLLQVILGYGEMALEEAGAESPAGASVEEMLKAGGRAKTLVSQLLAFSRRQLLDTRDVDLNDAVGEMLKMLRRVIGEHIDLGFYPAHHLGVVRADPGQIGQVLTNLCLNGRDAMPTGGTLTIETASVCIDEAYCEEHPQARPGRFVLLSVTDSGCGMDEETLGKVFEPFFTTKCAGEGTGLGLSTVYGLINQHDGFVHVYSEVDKGTTFKIYLPLAQRQAPPVSSEIKRPPPGGNETILLAEDDEMVRQLTESILERAGYTVLTANNGEEALAVFEEHADAIDLLLLDVVMPQLGGRAVHERIHRQHPEVRALFASGYSMSAVHTNFVLEEGLNLIQKPAQRDDLLRKVREVLEADTE
jgi:two-component system, cell cycle sensor histidine kinase and response regulator CckA